MYQVLWDKNKFKYRTKFILFFDDIIYNGTNGTSKIYPGGIILLPKVREYPTRVYEIVVKHNEKKPIREIAKEMNINKNTVNMWIQRYRNENNVKRKQNCSKLRKRLEDSSTDGLNEKFKSESIVYNIP